MARPNGRAFCLGVCHGAASICMFLAAMPDIEDLVRIALKTGLEMHRDLGPGLLESAYETLMQQLLLQEGLSVERQKAIPLLYKGIAVEDAFKADLLVERRLLIELKSVEKIAPVHAKQVLT